MANPMPRLPPVTSTTWSSMRRNATCGKCLGLGAFGFLCGTGFFGMDIPDACEDSRFPSLEAVRLSATHQGEEFFARLMSAEGSKHRRCHRGRMLLLHAAHHHAKMTRLDDDAHS